MKKAIVSLAAVVMVLCAGVARADDSDFNVSLGIKAWYNAWTHNVDYSDGTSHSWNNGSAFMIGPALNLKWHGVFVGASYLQSTNDYKANDWKDPVTYPGNYMEFERKDTDVTLGYMFVPYFGLFVGYKDIEAPMKYTQPGSTLYNKYDYGTWKLSGPGLGIVANAPLGQSAALYGNLAFLSVKQEFEYKTTTSTSFDMTGASFELGAAFAFSRHVSSNVGFKYQTFWGDDSGGNTHYQNFYGLTLGLNYTF